MSSISLKVARTHRGTCITRLATSSVAALALALAAGCGNAPTTGSTGTSKTPTSGTAAMPSADAKPLATALASTTDGGLGGRTGMLTNPEDTQMVFLYYDLAGLPAPIDQWVAEDHRVGRAPGAKKAAVRKQVRAELMAGLAAVKGVGVLHLTTYAHLSHYDPTYGEFMLGALPPGSQYTFDALRRHVAVKFDTGLDAQTWRVPKARAQTITDKFGDANLRLDVELKITKVLPASRGGTLVTHVESWTLHDARHGTTVARVKVASR